MDLVVDSRVPLGAGLSSSAALECAVALAAAEVGRRDRRRRGPRARWCGPACAPSGRSRARPPAAWTRPSRCSVEPESALLLDCRDWSTPPGALGPGRGRPDAAGRGHPRVALAQRTAATSPAARTARPPPPGSASTCCATSDRTRPPPSPPSTTGCGRGCGTCSREIARVREAVDLLEAGDVEGLGATFLASHASLRDDYEVSCAELDVVVDTAMAHGALGARMTGGGFGGSAIALVRTAGVDAVRDGRGRGVRRAGLAGAGAPHRAAQRRRPPAALRPPPVRRS